MDLGSKFGKFQNGWLGELWISPLFSQLSTWCSNASRLEWRSSRRGGLLLDSLDEAERASSRGDVEALLVILDASVVIFTLRWSDASRLYSARQGISSRNDGVMLLGSLNSMRAGSSRHRRSFFAAMRERLLLERIMCFGIAEKWGGRVLSNDVIIRFQSDVDVKLVSTCGVSVVKF